MVNSKLKEIAEAAAATIANRMGLAPAPRKFAEETILAALREAAGEPVAKARAADKPPATTAIDPKTFGGHVFHDRGFYGGHQSPAPGQPASALDWCNQMEGGANPSHEAQQLAHFAADFAGRPPPRR